MRFRAIAVALAVSALVLAACGSQQVAASVSVTVPTTVTVTASPTLDSSDECAAARNELSASGVEDVMEQALAGQQMPTIAFATPVKNYSAVSPGSASPEVADAIIAVNKAVAGLEASPFTLWTDTQTAALATAYKNLESACS